MNLRQLIELSGISISLGCMYTILRILFWLSLGYKYISFEDNFNIIYLEIIVILIGIVIMLYLVVEVILYR